MQIAHETGIQVLTEEQVAQVSGGKLFGYVVGYILGASGGPVGSAVMGQAVSDLEDWVNGTK